MKKHYTLLISLCLAAVLFCQSGTFMTISAEETNTKINGNSSLVQLVNLKKYLAKSPRSYNREMDYNADEVNNAEDIVTLRRRILGLPTYDKDGFNNRTVRP